MNALQYATSPYLLQHRNNPVNWYPWTDDALKLAVLQNKLLIISIGYSACHWCHVMEHESFEDEAVAEVMNLHFVSIKIDREERPDIDQIYMNAAMLLNGQGGWPLNVIALPDGKPIYAGTYFPKQQWMQLLDYFALLYKKEPQKLIEQAAQITNGVHKFDTIPLNTKEQNINSQLQEIAWQHWRIKIDYEWGGAKGAPKFMMPNNYEYLLRYVKQSENKDVANALKITLKKMAFGGLYDVVGGGFARYSVDAFWKIPHFEKMLYDNGQLLSVYAQAYQLTKRPLYKSVIEKTADWMIAEMTDSSGGLYASLDADSERMEGKYYCWTYAELQHILREDFSFFCDVYHIEEKGNFEHGLNVLFRTEDHEYFMDKYNIDNAAFQQKLTGIHQVLLEERKKKIRPATDDKILTEWNAIAIKGLCDAYKALGDIRYLQKAETVGNFILQYCKKDDYRLDRNFKNGQSSINGFLADYAFFIEALLHLHQVTLQEKYLTEALHFTEYVLEHFYNKTNGMFYITSDLDPPLITRSSDNSDNVIPSANSTMTKNLLLLSKYFDKSEYEQMSWTQLNNVLESAVKTPMYYSNWLNVLDMHLHLNSELVIIGKDAVAFAKKINANFLPNVLITGSCKESRLPLCMDRYNSDKTLFYLCRNKACDLPEEDIQAILNKLR